MYVSDLAAMAKNPSYGKIVEYIGTISFRILWISSMQNLQK